VEQGAVLVLHIGESIGRFMRHVLPAGFKRIRHYGLLSPARKRSGLAAARAALAVPTPSPATVDRLPTFCAASHASSISAARDCGVVLSTDSASGCPGVRPRWHSPRSRHSTAVRPLHPDGCSKRAVLGHRMARLGSPKKRSLHAKGLTPQDHGLQSP